MIFIGGVGSRIKQVNGANCICPACGASASMHISKKYSVVTLFFVPVLPFGAEYIATCSSCASVMEVQRESGRMLERDSSASILPGDLHILKNNVGNTCPHCRASVYPTQNFCPQCGERL